MIAEGINGIVIAKIVQIKANKGGGSLKCCGKGLNCNIK